MEPSRPTPRCSDTLNCESKTIEWLYSTASLMFYRCPRCHDTFWFPVRQAGTEGSADCASLGECADQLEAILLEVKEP